MSNPTDWTQLYQTGFSNTTNPTPTQTPPITTNATITTTSRTNNPPNPDDHSRSSPSSRPIRRRSRASRRNPTTLLNTDTTNFRAMVQQFTGGPTAHFEAGPQLPGPGPNFGFARPSVPHVQYPNQAMQQQQQRMSMMMNYNVHAGAGGGVHAPPRPSAGDDDRSFGNYML